MWSSHQNGMPASDRPLNAIPTGPRAGVGSWTNPVRAPAVSSRSATSASRSSGTSYTSLGGKYCMTSFRAMTLNPAHICSGTNTHRDDHSSYVPSSMSPAFNGTGHRGVLGPSPNTMPISGECNWTANTYSSARNIARRDRGLTTRANQIETLSGLSSTITHDRTKGVTVVPAANFPQPISETHRQSALISLRTPALREMQQAPLSQHWAQPRPTTPEFRSSADEILGSPPSRKWAGMGGGTNPFANHQYYG